VKPEVVARTASGTLRPWRELHENAPDLHVICQSPRAASRVGRLRRYPQRVAANPPLEIKPAPAQSRRKKTVKFTTAAKAAKPSDQPVKQTEKSEEKPASANPPKPETPPALPSDTSEAVRQKAKTKIAASIEEPASAEFHDMKRALRKKTFWSADRHDLRPRQRQEKNGREHRRAAVSLHREGRYGLRCCRRQLRVGGGCCVPHYLQQS
jgi:hypothetical protein